MALPKDPVFGLIEYEKKFVKVIKTTIKIPEVLQEQLIKALKSALWDIGFITKDSPNEDKVVNPVKYMTLDDGRYRIVFAVEVGSPKNRIRRKQKEPVR